MANRRKSNPLVRVTVSLDPDDYREFETLARDEGLSTAYLIRRAMRQYLGDGGHERFVESIAPAGGGTK